MVPFLYIINLLVCLIRIVCLMWSRNGHLFPNANCRMKIHQGGIKTEHCVRGENRRKAWYPAGTEPRSDFLGTHRYGCRAYMAKKGGTISFMKSFQMHVSRRKIKNMVWPLRNLPWGGLTQRSRVFCREPQGSDVHIKMRTSRWILKYL